MEDGKSSTDGTQQDDVQREMQMRKQTWPIGKAQDKGDAGENPYM